MRSSCEVILRVAFWDYCLGLMYWVLFRIIVMGIFGGYDVGLSFEVVVSVIVLYCRQDYPQSYRLGVS